ncbi:MAG: hypothetical protein J5I90_09230, partial [Caldilineales bacterium]|nr:hypothetical protein [Caldilineales bacterium]
TEVKGTEDGKPVTYRIAALTVKGALPTGVAPAIAAIWLGEGRIPAGVHPPELALNSEAFFAELAQHGIRTEVTTTRPAE